MRHWFWGMVKGFLFRIEPEVAHRMVVMLIRLGIRMGNWPLRISGGTVFSGAQSLGHSSGSQSIEVFGLHFQSRVGLAAGFDKDAEMVRGLPALGFGFAEIGTVTPRPQPGNERPRLFRDTSQNALFNRMGFNGMGSNIVSMRLAQAKPFLPTEFRVGVNIGKNKDTPLDEAASDYVKAAIPFQGLADYMVVNVSSPNTPGLRSLQTVEALKPILDGVQGVLSSWARRPPLLLKLAPEVSGEELITLIQNIESLGIDGWVLTNTLSGILRHEGREYLGGWSGGPLTAHSRHRLIEARQATKLPIISVGGILSPEEAVERYRLGAELVQIYSGWIYEGPGFPNAVSSKLTQASRL